MFEASICWMGRLFLISNLCSPAFRRSGCDGGGWRRLKSGRGGKAACVGEPHRLKPAFFHVPGLGGATEAVDRKISSPGDFHASAAEAELKTTHYRSAEALGHPKSNAAGGFRQPPNSCPSRSSRVYAKPAGQHICPYFSPIPIPSPRVVI